MPVANHHIGKRSSIVRQEFDIAVWRSLLFMRAGARDVAHLMTLVWSTIAQPQAKRGQRVTARFRPPNPFALPPFRRAPYPVFTNRARLPQTWVALRTPIQPGWTCFDTHWGLYSVFPQIEDLGIRFLSL